MANNTPLSLFGAVGAAVLASACCTVPLLLVSAGIGGAWISTVTALEPLRPMFIAVSLGLIGFAFYHKSAVQKDEDCGCDDNSKPRRTYGLMIFLAIVSIGLIASPLFLAEMVSASDQPNTIVVRDSDLTTSVFAIEGMTCPTCTTTVEKALNRLTAIVQMEVTYEPARATVKYDSSRLSETDIMQAINDVGYVATVAEGAE